MSCRLLQYTCSMSISARHNKKGVLALIIWNSMVSTGISIVIELIDRVELISNWILIAPAVIVSIVVLWAFLYARYYPQPAIDRFDALVLIITPQNLLEVYRLVVLQANRSDFQLLVGVAPVIAQTNDQSARPVSISMASWC